MRDFFGLDDTYVRPVPINPWRRDILVAAALFVFALTSLTAYLSIDEAAEQISSPWAAVAMTVLACVIIVFRRRFPVGVLLLTTGAHFFLVGIWMPLVVSVPGLQILYFLALYSAVAWARNREAMMFAVLAVLLLMGGWVGFSLATNSAAFRLQYDTVPVMLMVSQVLINVAFFGGAVWLGRNAWLRARADAALEESQAVVLAQAAQLADQAIVGERLRIARELHDSVAHHVALIGVQAAAARRAMEKKPEEATRALLGVEETARQTVDELRTVLGSLRQAGDPATNSSVGLPALPDLLDQMKLLGLAVSCDIVGNPDLVDQLSVAQSATLYRVVQEALTNTRTHSTAREARVTLRLAPTMVEAEIVDDGRPRPNTGGGGMGQMGIRERVLALGGSAEMGARPERGYRVLVRLPAHLEDSP